MAPHTDTHFAPQNEEHLDTESDSSPTKQPQPLSQSTTHVNHKTLSIGGPPHANRPLKTVSTANAASMLLPTTAPTVPTTSRVLFKRSLDLKQKSENARKLGRFDELKNS